MSATVQGRSTIYCITMALNNAIIYQIPISNESPNATLLYTGNKKADVGADEICGMLYQVGNNLASTVIQINPNTSTPLTETKGSLAFDVQYAGMASSASQLYVLGSSGTSQNAQTISFRNDTASAITKGVCSLVADNAGFRGLAL